MVLAPVNPADYLIDDFTAALLPFARDRGTALMGMKALASGALPDTATAIRWALSQPWHTVTCRRQLTGARRHRRGGRDRLLAPAATAASRHRQPLADLRDTGPLLLAIRPGPHLLSGQASRLPRPHPVPAAQSCPGRRYNPPEHLHTRRPGRLEHPPHSADRRQS
jgi:hypothetical protein